MGASRRGSAVLEARIRGADRPDQESWQPIILSLQSPGDRARLEGLFAAGRVVSVADTLVDQIAELVATRNPQATLSRSELDAAAAQLLGEVPLIHYGSWIYYPWSHRLVHTLPRNLFSELRTSRNRNKITENEQIALLGLRIGVVGLSVGQSSAVTLALEGVGGSFRLADFDRLELSNMNRLRTSVADLGTNKAVITARAIFEVNPYAEIELFCGGLNEDNVDAFVGGPPALSIVLEECDDLPMKLLVRRRARHFRVPVVMETSDRGMIDVERFDLEPRRPILHGLVEDLDLAGLDRLTRAEKIPLFLRILGAEQMSDRLAGSLLEVESTLKTWPQLASAVTLGGALTTDVVRRIALDEFRVSGRFYVDIPAIVRDGAQTTLPRLDDAAVSASGVEEAPLPPVARVNGTMSIDDARTLVAYGATAPSGGNCQPWRFVWNGESLRCYRDAARSESMLDFRGCASHLALGAAVENIVLVATAMGLETSVRPGREAEDPLVAELFFSPSSPPRVPRHSPQVIAERVTNRRLGTRVELPIGSAETLTMVAEKRGCHLKMLTLAPELARLADVLAPADRLRLLSKRMHRELIDEIRWTPEEAQRTRDGLDVATLELGAADLAGMRLVSSWRVMNVVARVGGGASLEKPTRRALACASAVGLLTCSATGPMAYFEGGRTLQDLWLCATELGLALQPITAVNYLFARLERGQGQGLSKRERRSLQQVRDRFAEIFDVGPNIAELMLFRLAVVGAPSARSLRRSVDDIFEVVQR